MAVKQICTRSASPLGNGGNLQLQEMLMGPFVRPSGRRPDEMRAVSLEAGVLKHAEGSCLVKFGHTHVLCTASLENQAPPFLRGTGRGWVTAEYGMLPRATSERTRREAAAGKQSGRTQEIQRLVGRSLRAVTSLEVLGERQIIIDCDVLQADGGTRTASITGGFVALHQCISFMMATKLIARHAVKDHVAAVSCGIYEKTPVLDLDYVEDSAAGTDANFVLTGSGGLVELQGTAEGAPFSEGEFAEMLGLARKGTSELVALQKAALKL
jgi:ribonuclease PH